MDGWFDIGRHDLWQNEHIYPNAQLFEDQLHELSVSKGTRWVIPPIMEQLKAKAKAAVLLFSVVFCTLEVHLRVPLSSFSRRVCGTCFCRSAQWPKCRFLTPSPA
jgi:hypothetical protein